MEVLLIISVILNVIFIPAFFTLKSIYKIVEADERKYFKYWLEAIKKNNEIIEAIK